MSKPFDATTKQMVEAYPESWVVCRGGRVLGAIR